MITSLNVARLVPFPDTNRYITKLLHTCASLYEKSDIPNCVAVIALIFIPYPNYSMFKCSRASQDIYVD